MHGPEFQPNPNASHVAVIQVPEGWILIPQDLLSKPETNAVPRLLKVAEKLHDVALWFYRRGDHVAYVAEVEMNSPEFKKFDEVGEPLPNTLLMVDSRGAQVLVNLNDGTTRYNLPLNIPICQ